MTARGSGGVRTAGRVTAALPNAMFRVLLDDGHEVIAHVSGRQRLEIVRVLPGDRVSVEVSPLDTSRGRITSRLQTAE